MNASDLVVKQTSKWKGGERNSYDLGFVSQPGEPYKEKKKREILLKNENEKYEKERMNYEVE